MNYKLWFLLVAVDAFLLVFCIFKGNIIYSLFSLALALYLQRSSSKVDFPSITILGHKIIDTDTDK